MKVVFVLPKNPYGYAGGDTAVSRLLMETASELADVEGVCLGDPSPGRPRVPVRCVPKPPVRLAPLAARSLLRRRSLVHERFDVTALRDALRATGAGCHVAEHTYMAESVIAAGTGAPLHINAVVLESEAMRSRRGPMFAKRLEADRIWRDELRCFRAASTVRCLDRDEAARVRSAGVEHARALDLVLPPLERSAGSEKLALFVGDRSWPPNEEALVRLERLWPRIAASAPGARLLVIGRGPARVPGSLPGTDYAGFVPDVDGAWRAARVLLAPITTGGGVRVKILEAAARGVAVVTTREGAGSIGDYLPVEPVASDDEFVERAARLLSEDGAAAAAGDRLLGAVHDFWQRGTLHEQIASWLEL